MPLEILTINDLTHKYHLSKEERKDFQILLVIVSILSGLTGISLTACIFTFYPYITGM